MKEIKLPLYENQGFVELIDMMGDDYRILQTARVSTGSMPKKGKSADRGLIRYLYKNKHMSPFEQVVFTFHAKVPNFVMKQFLRHRTMSINELSQRYTKVGEEFFIPCSWRRQGTKNHQGSGETLNDDENKKVEYEYEYLVGDVFDKYNEFIEENGVAREMARMVLPSSTFTEFYFTVNLRNLLHFLELRLHEHAQKEIRDLAEAIFSIVKKTKRVNWTMEIFEEMTELEYVVSKILSNKKNNPRDLKEILEETFL